MALSATLSLSPLVAAAGQRIDGVIVISNSGGQAVNLVSVSPSATPGNIEFGNCMPATNASRVIPANGGTLAVPFTGVCFAAPIVQPEINVIVSAYVATDDGSEFSAPPTSIAVVPIQPQTAPPGQLPLQVTGRLDFSNTRNPGLIPSLFPYL